MTSPRGGLTAVVLVICAALLAACGPSPRPASGPPARTELVFSILSAEDQATSEPQWAPLIQDLSRALGLPVRPFFATNYTALIEAMRADQVQLGWFSALPALQAVNRANAEVVGRFNNDVPGGGYRAVLIVRRGSGITLDQVLACGRRRSFGIGDAQSTSGTLAPMTFLFAPRGLSPPECFSVVRSASHQANFFAVANGVVDVATNNTIEIARATRENPALAANVEVIWRSPLLPESSVVIRRDVDPELRRRIGRFFLTYGVGDTPEAVRQRQVLRTLSFTGVSPASDDYLDPVRLMQANTALEEARRRSDPAALAAAQARVDAIRRSMAAHGTRS